MHLYGSLASPFVQRVLMTARAKGHELELRMPPGEGGMRSPEFQAISPMGRIPLLELDDGTHICESEAIAAYLDETLSGPALLPADALRRARVRELIALALLEVGTGLRPLMIHLVFKMGDAPDVVNAARAQLGKGLDALDRLIDRAGPWAMGEPLTAADCALVPVLGLAHVVDAQAGTATAVAERGALAAYYRRACAQPLARRSADEMAQGFAAILARNAAR